MTSRVNHSLYYSLYPVCDTYMYQQQCALCVCISKSCKLGILDIFLRELYDSSVEESVHKSMLQHYMYMDKDITCIRTPKNQSTAFQKTRILLLPQQHTYTKLSLSMATP